MIGMSHLGRSILRHAVWLIALAALPITSCSHSCTLIYCPQGLLISLHGKFDPQTTYEITINEIRPDAGFSMKCWLAPPSSAGPPLTCASGDSTFDGKTIQIKSMVLQEIAVTVSANGKQLGEQRFTPVYLKSEPNGPGCGVCTQASVALTIPER